MMHQCAVRHGHLDMANMLLRYGASPSKCDDGEYTGETPLHIACEKGFVDIVELLLAAGADVSVRNWLSYQPIHCAALQDNPEVVQKLINAGAGMSDGTSVFSYACCFNAFLFQQSAQFDVACTLVTDPFKTTRSGDTAKSIAVMRKNSKVVSELLSCPVPSHALPRTVRAHLTSSQSDLRRNVLNKNLDIETIAQVRADVFHLSSNIRCCG